MAFEGFLGDLRARPLGLRRLGYLVSVTLHVPPLTLFVIAWLTRELVQDHALELPDPRPKQLVYYQVPVQLLDGMSGVLAGDHLTNGAVLRAGMAGGRPGSVGAGRRRSRRPLTYARPKKPAHGPVPIPAPAVGPDEQAAKDGSGSGTEGIGLGDDGAGGGEHGSQFGSGSGAATGGGTDVTGRGPLARRSQESVSLEAKLASWVPPELRKANLHEPELHRKERSHGGTTGHGEEAVGIEEGVGVAEVALLGPQLPGRPERVSMNYAAYLRTFDPLPTLPESCWPPGRLNNTALLEVCVTNRGEVDGVKVLQSAGDEVDDLLSTTMRTWRYRPRIVKGTTQPFCHAIRLVYTRAQQHRFR